MYLITNISKVYKSTLNHDSSAGCATGCPYRGLWFETPAREQNVFFIEKWLVSKIASTFKTHVRLFFQNGQDMTYSGCTVMGIDRRTVRPPATQTTHWTTDVVSSSWQSIQVLCIYSMFHRAILQQWKWMQLNEHWTTRVHKALPAKGIHENLKVCFPNISVQVEFNWYQNSVCWNISILHYRGRNHPKSRVQVHP